MAEREFSFVDLAVSSSRPRHVDVSGARTDLFELADVPTCPGSYQFFEGDVCLYVGKAKSLRARLGSYRRPLRQLEDRVASFVARATRVEWVEAPSESAALALEASLIAALQPVYNIRLREAHPYAGIAVDSRFGPARLRVWRGDVPAGVERFGPFPGLNVNEMFEAVLAAAPLRSCASGKFRTHQRLGRGCLLADVGKCSAPCVAVDEGQYAGLVEDVRGLLSGRGGPVVERLEVRMRSFAVSRQFEKAAQVRDQVAALRRLVLGAEVVDVAFAGLDADVWAVAADVAGSAVVLVEVRDGRVVGVLSWGVDGDVDAVVVRTAAVVDWYGRNRPPDRWPAVVVVDGPVEDRGGVEALLRAAVGVKVQVRRRGFGPLVEFAARNAEVALRRTRSLRAADAAARRDEAVALAAAIGLPVAPLVIEAVDISHASGRSTVSVVALLEDGLANRAGYSKFVLSTSGGDDYAAIYEVMLRRFDPAGSKRRQMPDLVLIDGGPGQLASACAALAELGVVVPVVALSKRFEHIHLVSGDVVVLPGNSAARLLLQRARDATHAASNAAQRQLESRRLRSDWLETVPGVGPARARRVRRAFGSNRALVSASREEVEALTFLPGAVRDELFAALSARRTQVAVDESVSDRQV